MMYYKNARMRELDDGLGDIQATIHDLEASLLMVFRHPLAAVLLCTVPSLDALTAARPWESSVSKTDNTDHSADM
jgi:hypothetical protein